MRCLALLLSGCLFAPDVYEARLDELDDDDKDGWSTDAGDCDDTDPDRFPGADETCDEADNDCDGDVDEGIHEVTGYADSDGDSFGDLLAPLMGCEPGGVADSSDCDDLDANVHPFADEHCDGADEDCDDLIDEDPADATEGFRDADADGFGDPAAPLVTCESTGLVGNADDCDDTREWVFPGAPERLDGVTNDCNSSGAADQLDADDADLVLTGSTGLGLAVSGLADYTGDGVDDLVVATPTEVILAIGPLRSGALDEERLRVSGFVAGLLGGEDLDGDGNRDFVYGRHDGLTIVDGNARGIFDPGTTLTGALRPLSLHQTALLAADDTTLSRWALPVREGSQAVLVATAPTAALLADTDGDGVDEVLVGSASAQTVWWLDTAATSAAEATTTTRDDETNSDFGATLLVPGDLDGDGRDDVVVGAPGADETGDEDGRAWVFTTPADSTAGATGWVLGKGAESRASATLAAPGDVSGDGLADVWIGGPGADPASGTVDGSFSLYLGPIVGRTESRARAALLQGTDGAGLAASVSPDLGTDGSTNLVLGAPGRATAYVFVTRFDP